MLVDGLPALGRTMANGQQQTVLRHLHRMLGVPDNGDPPDRLLLECFATTRDDDAFAALVKRHGALVWGVCWRTLRHAQDAEDCFQATFVVLARRAGSVRWHESVASWLYGVASRVAAEARRSGRGATRANGKKLSCPRRSSCRTRPPATSAHYSTRSCETCRGIALLDTQTPAWKRPLWLWVKTFNAWPSSPEAVASAFNYNRAPFFQSFMEVRVEGSSNTVRFWL
jgi:RNA polymerase sigma factor (sigma-70 family)